MQGKKQTVWVDIQRQAEHISSSPAVVITSHWIASYLHYKSTMMPIAIHSQQETLICTLMPQGSLAAFASSLVILVVPADIRILCVRRRDRKSVV